MQAVNQNIAKVKSVRIFYVLLIFVFCGIFAACKDVPQNDTHSPWKHYTNGKATWYGPGFHGKTTASGEVFNKNKLTAAHRKLKFGTKVRVTNQVNQKQVVVTINDRGPKSKNISIDLSEAAAKKIDMIESGVVPVKIEVYKPKKK